MGNKLERKSNNSIIHTFLEKIRISGLLAIWFAIFTIFTISYFLISQANAVTGYGWEIDHGRAIANAIITSASSISQFTATGYENPGTTIKILMSIESIIGLIIYALLFAKLVAFKQDNILEEIREINQEETFTSYRRGLSLVRADILVIIDKLDGKNIKQREVKDLWIIFSGLDQTLTNIKSFFMPENNSRAKPINVNKFELILSSMKLTMTKVLELIKSLNTNSIDWKEEMLLTSIHYDMQIIRDMIDYQLPRTTDKKLIEKINSTKIVLEDLEKELRIQQTIDEPQKLNIQDEIVQVQNEPDHEEQNQNITVLNNGTNTEEEIQHLDQKSQSLQENSNSESTQPEIQMINQDPPHDPRVNQEHQEHRHHHNR